MGGVEWSGLIIGTIFLSRTAQTTFANDWFLQSSIVILLSSGLVLLGISSILPRDAAGRARAISLTELGRPHASRSPSPTVQVSTHQYSERQLRVTRLILVLALCFRIELLRRVLANVQCSTTTLEPLVPLVFTIWDFWSLRRARKQPSRNDTGGGGSEASNDVIRGSPYAYLIAVSLTSLGGFLALNAGRAPSSTYICAGSMPYLWVIPQLQRLGSILDVVVVFCLDQILNRPGGRDARSNAMQFASVGWIFIFSASIVFAVGAATHVFIERSLIGMLNLSYFNLWSLLKLDVSFVLTLVCAIALMFQYEFTTISLWIVFLSISTIITGNLWTFNQHFPPIATVLGILGTCMMILGFGAYFQVEPKSEVGTGNGRRITVPKVPAWFYLALLCHFITWTALWGSQNGKLDHHPIDLLVYEAQQRHQAYAQKSHSSKTLSQAVQTYKDRYGRYPPPGFDAWYEYATARDSVIIDDYDSISRDLLPFYALSPAAIRERTWELVSNPWNDAASVHIRSGEVSLNPNMAATHRWMTDGLSDMIQHFSKSLPDMDLAFNLNDECRVTVPFDEIESLRRTGEPTRHPKIPYTGYSDNRAEQWLAIPEKSPTTTPFTEKSWQRVFYEFGNLGCPSNSAARTSRHWNVGELCYSCTQPHSTGAFLSNWTLSGNICHQPDLADLHGLYISPSAFKTTAELYPIFSQSKIHGFNDILYPSAWNYLDKAKYDPNAERTDPPFGQKNATLFWRGTTSEGFSSGRDQWQGMTRQRFIHLANDIPNTHPAPQAILLPEPITSRLGNLKYVSFPIRKLTSLFATDVHIVDAIARCGGHDCEAQNVEFGPMLPPTDFQDHWKYKYLLDLDGGGFSGRFLPFLHSRSLPFKAALFREWWEDRLTAWHHFVPLDVRGHGFWATLAWATGVHGTINGREVQIDAHARDAERIAEQGREWAGKVLRKEDMEIYMFRLLLEWARLTDDRRDELGFDVT